MRPLLALVLLAVLAALPASAAEPLAGRIWQPATGDFITPDQLLAQAMRADAVLLGETHDNPGHHALQAWVVRALAEAGRRPAVAFEMIDADQQPQVDAWLAGHPGDAAGLGEAVAWDKRGWPDWAMYRPIAEAALKAGQPIISANLPRTPTREISRGQETPETAARLGLDKPLDQPVAEAMAEEIRAGHCNMLPESAVPAMVRVQRARDASMAAAVAGLLARPQGGTAVLIAGAGHVRADRGVPVRLQALAPGRSVLAVGFVEVQPGEAEPADYAAHFGAARLPFDAVWFTERTEREDPCGQMERHMRGKK
ncbi:MAG: ChaN family lipoprotein [Actinomycetota bacterium]